MPLEIGTASASALIQDFFDSLASLPSRLSSRGLPWTYSTSHNYAFNDYSYDHNNNFDHLRNGLYKTMHLYWVIMSVFMLLFIYYCVFGFLVGIAGGELDSEDLEKMARESKESVLKGLDDLQAAVDQVAGGGKSVIQEKIQAVTEKVEEKLEQSKDNDRRKSWGGRKQEEAFEENQAVAQGKDATEEKANWEAQEGGDDETAIDDGSDGDSKLRGGGIKDKVWRRRQSDAAKTEG